MILQFLAAAEIAVGRVGAVGKQDETRRGFKEGTGKDERVIAHMGPRLR